MGTRYERKKHKDVIKIIDKLLRQKHTFDVTYDLIDGKVVIYDTHRY